MGATWPLIVNRLVTWLPTLPGWGDVAVYDGHPVTADISADYLTVGYTTADDQGGVFTQTRNPDGSGMDESGDVRCHLACQSGDGDLATVRARAFALTDAFDAGLRADQTLGGLLSRNAEVLLSVDVLSVQNVQGAAQSLLFTVRYWNTGYLF